MKKILAALLIIVILSFTIIPARAYQPNEQELALLYDKIESCREEKDNAHALAECARYFNLDEEHFVIQFAKEKWWDAHYRELYWLNFEQKLEEYPIATITWLYLKDLGYNDYVCAGILGNMMVEVGGLTLDLLHDIYAGPGNSFYGLCMWYIPFSDGIAGLNLLEQLDYLKNNIKYEIDTFGYFYYQGFNYDAFLQIENIYDAAMAFCVSYERCEASSYSYRVDCAYAAYEYFVNNISYN